MRKVAFAVLAMAVLLVGCTSIECSMNNTVVSQYCFMQHCDEGNDTTIWLDRYYLTVSVNHIENGADTVYLNKQGKTTTLKLPVSYAYKNDTLFFEFQDTLQKQAQQIQSQTSSSMKDFQLQAGNTSEEFSKKLYSAEEQTKNTLKKLTAISLIPTILLIIWELIRHIWLLN